MHLCDKKEDRKIYVKKDTLSVCKSFIGRRVFGVGHLEQASVKRVKSQCRIVFIALEALK